MRRLGNPFCAVCEVVRVASDPVIRLAIDRPQKPFPLEPLPDALLAYYDLITGESVGH
jgi:hypothetical protein